MSHPLRILVVDDDRAHAEFVAELIRFAEPWRDAQVDTATSYTTAVAAIGSRAYDVALFDYLLDTSDGLSLLREVRASGVDTPIVVLTGHGAEDVAVEAMKAGAADYLSKANLTSESIAMAIRYALSLAATERERRRAEQALKASEERFRALVENSSDILLLLDRAGRITYTTPSVERVLGWSPGELPGLQVFDLLHPDDFAGRRERLPELLARPGEIVPSEVRFRHADGSYRTMEAVAVNRLAEPAVSSIVLNARDVTDRRTLEDQLRQVQKMEAVGRLAGGVAHDFNNMLTAILGYATLLLDELPPDAALRTDVEEIRKAGERAARLTRQLLAFSRRQPMQPEPIDLSDAVAQTEKMLVRLLGEDIELAVTLAPGLPSVKADPASLEQILINLAINGRDAMPEGGRLTIDTARADLDQSRAAAYPGAIAGAYVRLTVGDSGAGLDEAQKERIFEPFSSAAQGNRAAGLGLAAVYGLVRQSGGFISVSSEPGRGTKFEMHFPVMPSAALNEPAVASVAPASHDEGTSGRETVLIVEDEEAVRTLGREVLRRNGYAVLEARTAVDALQLGDRHDGAIDLVVTDIVMPHMTGRELADRLRELRPSLKVLFVSGYADHAVVHRALAAGAPILHKPFTPDLLVRRVRSLLDDVARSRPS